MCMQVSSLASYSSLGAMAWVGAAPLSVSLRVDPMQQSCAGTLTGRRPLHGCAPWDTFALCRLSPPRNIKQLCWLPLL